MAHPYERVIEDNLLHTVTRMRQAAGINPQSLAIMMDVSNVTIWKWENGAAFPRSLARLRKLIEVLGAKLEIKVTTKDNVEFIF